MKKDANCAGSFSAWTLLFWQQLRDLSCRHSSKNPNDHTSEIQHNLV